MKEYDNVKINGDIPLPLRYLMVFIDRVGFPILAFCLMFWLSYQSIEKVSSAIELNTIALARLDASFASFSTSVQTDHARMQATLERMLLKKQEIA